MTLILAIESSCDETAVAIINENHELLANVVSSQIDTHRLYGGVVPEIASRLHVENIGVVLEQAIEQAKLDLHDLDAIAVTKGPGLVGSLHVGLQAAKTLALAYRKPLIGVHHIAGHIYANNLVDRMEYPCMALVVSGGHTELVYMDRPMHFEVIGTTYDDAIGEAFDKVARVAGLPYPGGPAIDRLAQKGKHRYDLPRPLHDKTYNFSFSGLKSAVINLAHNTRQRGETLVMEDLARSFEDVAIGVLVDKTIQASLDYKVKQIVVAGGVAANSYLRESMQKAVESTCPDIRLSIPPLWCCTDNAAMIASAALEMYQLKQFSDLSLSCKPMIDLEG